MRAQFSRHEEMLVTILDTEQGRREGNSHLGLPAVHIDFSSGVDVQAGVESGIDAPFVALAVPVDAGVAHNGVVVTVFVGCADRIVRAALVADVIPLEAEEIKLQAEAPSVVRSPVVLHEEVRQIGVMLLLHERNAGRCSCIRPVGRVRESNGVEETVADSQTDLMLIWLDDPSLPRYYLVVLRDNLRHGAVRLSSCAQAGEAQKSNYREYDVFETHLRQN